MQGLAACPPVLDYLTRSVQACPEVHAPLTEAVSHCLDSTAPQLPTARRSSASPKHVLKAFR